MTCADDEVVDATIVDPVFFGPAEPDLPPARTRGRVNAKAKDRARRKYVARYPNAWCGPRAEASRRTWQSAPPWWTRDDYRALLRPPPAVWWDDDPILTTPTDD